MVPVLGREVEEGEQRFPVGFRDQYLSQHSAGAFTRRWKDLKLPDGRDRVVRHGAVSRVITAGERFAISLRGSSIASG
jgi:hypothetical protein